VAITSEEEKKNYCVDGPLVALLKIREGCAKVGLSLID
jgi:hypothetical protein